MPRAALLAVLVSLLGPATAGAAPFAPTLSATASPTAAGAATTLTTTISRPSGDADVDRFALHLPPGLAGSLAGVARCADAQVQAGACPADSRVGTATAAATAAGLPTTSTGSISLTDAPAGSGALAGLVVLLPARAGPVDLGTLVSRSVLRVRADQGIDVVTDPLPRTAGGLAISLSRLDLVLDRPGFTRNASSCAAQAITADLVAQDGQTATASAPYAATACGAQPYAPRLGVTLDRAGPLGHTAVTTTITQSAAEAANRSAVVTLPRGVSPEVAAIGRACPPTQLSAGTCPASATIGTATAVTPLLPTPLSGDVLLVRPASGVLPELAIRLRGALAVDLRATTALTPDGRLRTTFPSLPDVPLTRFGLTFVGGPSGIITTLKGTCALTDRRFDAAFTSQGGRGVDAPGTATVTGCPGTTRSTRPTARASLRGRSVVVTVRAGSTAIRQVSASRAGRRIARRLGRPARAVTLRLRLAAVPRRAFRVRVAVTPAKGRPIVLSVRVGVPVRRR